MGKKVEQTVVTITTRSVGQSFAIVGEVRRGTSRRLIHSTAPYPIGAVKAAHRSAYEWAFNKGYSHINEVAK
jgi:hypothetical protein